MKLLDRLSVANAMLHACAQSVRAYGISSDEVAYLLHARYDAVEATTVVSTIMMPHEFSGSGGRSSGSSKCSADSSGTRQFIDMEPVIVINPRKRKVTKVMRASLCSDGANVSVAADDRGSEK